VASREGGLYVLDISDAANPVLVGRYDTSGNSYGVAIFGEYACLADYFSGLHMMKIFQNDFDATGNTARSAGLGIGHTVESVRVTTVQTDSIGWEVSADSGSNWQSVRPDGSWLVLDHPGEGLLWRSTHLCALPGINPACSYLEIEYNADPAAAGGWRWSGVFSLAACSPNPFVLGISVRFSIANPEAVRLTVYDVTGRRVAVIEGGYYEAGEHTVWWDGRDDWGRVLSPGIYIVQIKAAGNTATRKVVKID
jgi:hypothetical protein